MDIFCIFGGDCGPFKNTHMTKKLGPKNPVVLTDIVSKTSSFYVVKLLLSAMAFGV